MVLYYVPVFSAFLLLILFLYDGTLFQLSSHTAHTHTTLPSPNPSIIRSLLITTQLLPRPSSYYVYISSQGVTSLTLAIRKQILKIFKDNSHSNLLMSKVGFKLRRRPAPVIKEL